ncbi:hypothetical protein NPIL_235171 [Nephila pilipes]|uniref:Uncharacterized protein n=1 Tax=Nephila pilipes TaxID=299642 RepID=A0A8X6M5P5_NEPPI|nr:hypothetical protein NPIL_235171 [Nephila pilipes]
MRRSLRYRGRRQTHVLGATGGNYLGRTHESHGTKVGKEKRSSGTTCQWNIWEIAVGSTGERVTHNRIKSTGNTRLKRRRIPKKKNLRCIRQRARATQSDNVNRKHTKQKTEKSFF